MPHVDKKKAIACVIDLDAGFHRYVTVEGVCECREHVAQLVRDRELHLPDVVLVYQAE